MITSFSRLFRQIFGGPRVAPETEATARAVGADVEAQDAAAHRESLKRAMEAAFATPTAGPEEPLTLTTPLEEQVAAIEAAVAAEAPVELDVVEELAPEPAAAELAGADPLPAWHTIDITEPPVEEIMPALDLAEVEETEIDREPTPIAAAAEEPAQDVEAEAVTAEEPVEEIVTESVAVFEPAAEAPAEEAAELESVAETTEEEVADVVAGEPAVEEVAEERAAAAPKAKRTKKASAKPKKKAATTKRKPAKKAASLEDGVWLSDAIVYSLNGEWTSTWTPPEDASAAERLELFREKAAAGEFAVWGCAEGSDAWEPIKPAYWKTALVEPLSFLMGRENVATDPKASKAKNPVKYTALKVVRPDIEALWPPATSTGTVRDAA